MVVCEVVAEVVVCEVVAAVGVAVEVQECVWKEGKGVPRHLRPRHHHLRHDA